MSHKGKGQYTNIMIVPQELDDTLGKKYVAFKDPDRIAWEFYMM